MAQPSSQRVCCVCCGAVVRSKVKSSPGWVWVGSDVRGGIVAEPYHLQHRQSRVSAVTCQRVSVRLCNARSRIYPWTSRLPSILPSVIFESRLPSKSSFSLLSLLVSHDDHAHSPRGSFIMGVTGLWTILHPCARPIKLETLNRKRLAVDASIWIYQFLKAVRDKEGNALRNSHVVGFFRRICKLLFFGIKPVFVFDGGAPALKRQTVSERKKKREGRREDAVRTAGKLLAVQMQRRAEEDEQKRRDENRRAAEQEEELPENLVYADENMMSAQERQQSRKFKKKDQYHLPDLDVSMNEMGGPNDPRVMSLEELQAYAKQFETGEDINVYDFSKIDYDSPFFTSLPASDRYNILNAARLRSRLRMGHSKEQLDNMFPDRMAFSKFQIERVRERNELTQRLMHVNEGGDTAWDGGRIAGEKGREYVLVKNDGVEGGWALGVIGGDEGTNEDKAIDIDMPEPTIKDDEEAWEDDDGFEDVPIEGLNRLPKRQKLNHDDDAAYAKQRRAFYKSRSNAARSKPKQAVDPNSLFVQDDPAEVEGEDQWEEVDADGEQFGGGQDDEDEELNRAIAMSLQKDEPEAPEENGQTSDAEDDDMLEVFQQSAVEDARPVPKGSARAIASVMNKRAHDTAPESREVTSFGVPALREEESDQEDTMDLQAALAESRRTKRKVSSPRQRQSAKAKPSKQTDAAKAAGFSGPLPFEKLDLGSSLLGKKKMHERTEETAGGFENPELAEKQKKAEPLPPWFSGDLESDIQKQRDLEDEDRQKAKDFSRQFQFQSRDEPKLRRHETNEVIDLDSDNEEPPAAKRQVIDLEGADAGHSTGGPTMPLDDEVRMGDVADKVHVEPPVTIDAERRKATPQQSKAPPFMDDSDEENALLSQNAHVSSQKLHGPQTAPTVTQGDEQQPESPVVADGQPSAPPSEARATAQQQAEDEDEEIPWSESEDEDRTSKFEPSRAAVPSEAETRKSRSPSVDFEDVAIPDEPASPAALAENAVRDDSAPAPASGLADQQALPDDEIEQAEFDDFSDPEDEELLHQLTVEAEEHARFASTLNNKSQAENIAEYEKELKQLRNQQKKDRRDADEVTHIMIQECQQLLRLFGLPYVTAPMEAEAQCAELVNLGLVDGIVTDDSDCFLFGGTRIYKNMFNQAKFVECYLSSDLEKEFDLTRDKMVSIAHLLGSDYTEGLPGIGPVTALEILGEFPNLEDFKMWWSGVQMNTISKSEDKGNGFRKKFRKNSTKLFLPPNFPDARVSGAYHKPEVDSDPSPFEWGVPDLDALRSFLMSTIGWSQERTDEVLVPVIRDMNRRADEGTQSNITAFFDGGVGIGAAGSTKASARGEGFAPRKRVQESSKRMGSALSRMAEKAKGDRSGGQAPANGEGEDAALNGNEEPQKADVAAGRGKKGKGKKRAKTAPEAPVSGDDSDVSETEAPKQKKRRAPARRKKDAAAAV